MLKHFDTAPLFVSLSFRPDAFFLLGYLFRNQ